MRLDRKLHSRSSEIVMKVGKRGVRVGRGGGVKVEGVPEKRVMKVSVWM